MCSRVTALLHGGAEQGASRRAVGCSSSGRCPGSVSATYTLSCHGAWTAVGVRLLHGAERREPLEVVDQQAGGAALVLGRKVERG